MATPVAAAPYEIIVGPYEVWIAPGGTSPPDMSVAPPGPWEALPRSGQQTLFSGTDRHTEEGVTIALNQTIESIRANGPTLPVKAVRTEEDVMVSFTMLDTTVDSIRYALNSNAKAVTAAAAGVAGRDRVDLSRGPVVRNHALLVRGAGPVQDTGEDWRAQFYLPRAYAGGNPELVYSKNGATGVAFEFMSLSPNSGDMAPFYEVQTADAN